MKFKLKEVRKRAGLTQTALAESIGLTLQGIQYMEAKSGSIPINRFEAICKALNATPCDFFDCPSREVEGFSGLALQVYEDNKLKGFWDSDRTPAECIALIHSECSELLEAYRTDNPPSAKLDNFSQAEEELADIIIRCLDFAGRQGMDVDGAIAAKLAYNRTRPPKHGKKF